MADADNASHVSQPASPRPEEGDQQQGLADDDVSLDSGPRVPQPDGQQQQQQQHAHQPQGGQGGPGHPHQQQQPPRGEGGRPRPQFQAPPRGPGAFGGADPRARRTFDWTAPLSDIGIQHQQQGQGQGSAGQQPRMGTSRIGLMGAPNQSHTFNASFGAQAPLMQTAALPTFSGESKAGEYPPETFIVELDTRRQAQGMSDEATISLFRMQLRSEARYWFENFHSMLHHARERRQWATDWEFVKFQFLNHYRAGRATRKVNWKDLLVIKDPNNASAYIQNFIREFSHLFRSRKQVFSQHMELSEAHAREMAARVMDCTPRGRSPYDTDLYQFLAGEQIARVEAWYLDNLQTIARHMADALLREVSMIYDNVASGVQTSIITSILVDHLPSPLRTKAAEYMERNPEATVLDLNIFIIKNTQGKGQTQKVYAIAEGETDEDQGDLPEAGVEALKAQIRDANKKLADHAKRQKQNGGNGNKAITCDYCKKKGHKKKECKKRLKDLKKKKAIDEVEQTKSEEPVESVTYKLEHLNL